ncbi:MAG: hypothetical protein NTZ80_01305 [Patescibacteria group bacterium]|nr:hypothetical protein [Patescibacteria group bacterium]
MQKTLQQIYDLLPAALKQAVVSIDSLNKGNVLYNFGNASAVDGNPLYSFGTGENQELRILYLAVLLADQFLSKEQRDEWLKKLGNKDKHQDYIFEMRPLLGLRAGSIVEYENHEDCEKGKSVDWKIQNDDWTFLFEIKNRFGSIIDHVKACCRIARQVELGVPTDQIVPVSMPSNAESLFKSVESKFKIQARRNILQGVWINTAISEDQEKLQKYFDEKLDSQKVQFAIFAGWHSQAKIFVREEHQKVVLMDLLGLTCGGLEAAC